MNKLISWIQESGNMQQPACNNDDGKLFQKGGNEWHEIQNMKDG